ncbi:hypothetical protein [Sneathiella chinensis]|uniref:Hemolysin-type calcium-binding repeat-containing protein n=1 Tax=Sneathiella chinensis TaxID=349750 RepID=A0ABQ5U3Z2_9PROT|nr:hypothetical protein [Sneathiella chinensis]GLQ06885.1 hypothetical protein GCM10007924_21060 [Sneathiella chinensis]
MSDTTRPESEQVTDDLELLTAAGSQRKSGLSSTEAESGEGGRVKTADASLANIHTGGRDPYEASQETRQDGALVGDETAPETASDAAPDDRAGIDALSPGSGDSGSDAGLDDSRSGGGRDRVEFEDVVLELDGETPSDAAPAWQQAQGAASSVRAPSQSQPETGGSVAAASSSAALKDQGSGDLATGGSDPVSDTGQEDDRNTDRGNGQEGGFPGGPGVPETDGSGDPTGDPSEGSGDGEDGTPPPTDGGGPETPDPEGPSEPEEPENPTVPETGGGDDGGDTGDTGDSGDGSGSGGSGSGSGGGGSNPVSDNDVHDPGLQDSATLIGTDEDDQKSTKLMGTNHTDDIIYGLGGDDDLMGKGGNDTLVAGDGDDTIKAGQGDDHLYGGAGDDDLRGEGGDDLIYGGAGNDDITGGVGNDTIYGGTGDDHVVGGAGDDMFYFGGNDGMDTFVGGNGGGWSDTIVLTDGLPGGDVSDWLTLTSGSIETTDDGAIFLSEDASGTITLGEDAVLTFEGVEKIEG